VAGRFLDTNILLYAAAHQALPADESKHQAALDLIGEGDFAVSAQVLQEFYANAVRLKPTPLAPDVAQQWVELLSESECVPIDQRLVLEGIALSRRFKTSYWDGAIVAAAHAVGCKTLYSEDLDHGQTYGDVTVINPFKPQTH
jgi:predicted nucleic acid-binding protein